MSDRLSRNIKSVKGDWFAVGLNAYFIISDIASGNRRRFTVYRMKLLGDKAATVIGREVTEAQAKKLIVEENK